MEGEWRRRRLCRRARADSAACCAVRLLEHCFTRHTTGHTNQPINRRPLQGDDVAESFGNTDKVVRALLEGAVVADRSHWGRVRVAGADRLQFLHSQSTADIKALRPGQGADTVFVTATGRCLDLALALVMEESVLLVVSPGMREALLERFDKFIFPADKVEVADVTERCRMFTVAGPKAGEVLREIGGVRERASVCVPFCLDWSACCSD